MDYNLVDKIILESIIAKGHCVGIKCSDCPLSIPNGECKFNNKRIMEAIKVNLALDKSS